jgi:hypothetical protein
MRHARAVLVLWVSCVLALAGGACESARNPGGFQRDLVPPTISLTDAKTPPAIDTQPIAGGLNFTVGATDNLALNDIRLIFSGGYVDTIDTVFFNQTLPAVTLPVHIVFPAGSGAGGLITAVGRATDGAGNFAEDTLVIFLSNINALSVVLLSPAPGALASQGKYVPIHVVATQTSGIQRIGWLIGGVVGQTAVRGDSVTLGAPFPTTYDLIDSVLVTGTVGTFTVTGFAVDAANRRGVTATVTVTIQSAANDVTAPRVEQTVALRAESSDSITVHATDPSGITRVGFVVRDTLGVVIGGDSLDYAGNSTDISKKFSLNLSGITSFPTRVVVQAFAIDGATGLNRGVSGVTFAVPSPIGPARTDTISIVAGITRALPFGGKIADAIFNKNANGGTGELYLTNTPLSRVEVFQVANTSFVASGIPTAGPQPWGIALWPRDTLGTYGDSIVVADAGGTEFSIIDVAARRLRWRQDLPNYQLQSYKLINVGGFYQVRITPYDLSDRPQYVGTVCRVITGTPNCHVDSVFALYSTTPTVSSTSPFNGKATLRMEKLKNTTDTAQLFGHFFWEIGNLAASDVSDTLRIVLMRPGQQLYGNYTNVILSACQGVTINVSTFGLGDSTFARNSGNFTHGFFGEGGNATANFRRVMAYNTSQPLNHGPPTRVTCQTSPLSANVILETGDNDTDFGMSPGVSVSDFISNTGAKVASIATNFNGGTNLVRADSIYVLDDGLRLKGTSPTTVGAYGMDMNYNHDFLAGQAGSTGLGGTRDSTNRVVFAADPSGLIRVFDTFFYNQIDSIPVRDPIVGPLRVAQDALGNQLLFGVTFKGLVMVRLPIFPNPNPAPPRFNRVRHSP